MLVVLLVYSIIFLSLAASVTLVIKAISRREYALIGSALPRLFMCALYVYGPSNGFQVSHTSFDVWINITIVLILFSDTLQNIVYAATRKYRKGMQELQWMELFGKLETKFHTMVEQCPTGIYAFDAKTGTINYANPVMCSFVGYERNELVGKDVYKFITPEDRLKVRKAVEDRLVGALEVASYDVRLISKSGSLVALHFEGRLFYNGNANIMGYAQKLC